MDLKFSAEDEAYRVRLRGDLTVRDYNPQLLPAVAADVEHPRLVRQVGAVFPDGDLAGSSLGDVAGAERGPQHIDVVDGVQGEPESGGVLLLELSDDVASPILHGVGLAVTVRLEAFVADVTERGEAAIQGCDGIGR